MKQPSAPRPATAEDFEEAASRPLRSAPASIDTSRAGADSSRAGADSSRAGADTLRAGADSSRAGLDTPRAGVDTSRAGVDTSRAGLDTLRAGVDTPRAGLDTSRAGVDALHAAATAAAGEPLARPCAPLLGESRAAVALRARIEAVTAVDTPVLLEGERGCGREHLARYLHSRGARRTAAFIRIDAEFADTERAADKLRRAHGGSVLIRDLPHGSARLSKLLAHWLDKNLAGLAGGALPLRVLATSDVELPRLLDAGLVDAGLLDRLGIVRLPVPPLRERAADIPLLCAHFLDELSAQSGVPQRTLSARALVQLSRYSFPGNLAELRDVIRRSALRARSAVIELGDVEAVLPPLHERVPLEELSLEAVVRTKIRALLQRLEGYPITDLYEQVLEHIERPLLEEVLARTAGNQLKAATMLGINRNTLRKKLQERAVQPVAAPPTPPADASR